eukprot:c24106_g1_i1 orf=329-1165(+)
MELFEQARTVKLRGCHGKYLWADDDECGVSQSRDGTKTNVKWAVEVVEGSSVVRLKSCYDCYLTATDVPFLLGVAGKKVLQMKPLQLDSSVEWEPIRDGFTVKLKTRYGNYLRANGTVPPWRNSVTHDIPHRSATQEWILWEVETLEKIDNSPPQRLELPSSLKPDGRTIYFAVGDDNGGVNVDTEWSHFLFKGHDLHILTEKLKEETGIKEEVVVCSYNQINNKLYPLRLQLPPNNMPMHIVVVKASSKLGRTFSVLMTGSIDGEKSFDQSLSWNAA